MKSSDHRNFKTLLILAVIVATLSLNILLNHRSKTKFHGDESGWITAGYYYATLLLNCDFEWQNWHNEELGTWGYMNPHVGKWLLGIPLKLHFADREFLRFYDFTKTYEDNQNEGNVPPHDMLIYARTVSAILGMLCCLVLFAFGCRCYNVWVGALAVILLVCNRLFQIYATRAMTDISYNLFLLSLGLCGLMIIRNVSDKRMVFGYLVLGAFSGLACSVKITGIAIGSLFVMTLLLYGYFVHPNKKTVFLFLAVYGFTSLAIVYFLDPLFWPDVTRFKRSVLIQEMRTMPEELNRILATQDIQEKKKLETAYLQETSLSHVLLFPYLFVKWDSFMTSQKNKPSASWHGHRLLTFHSALFKKYATSWWEFIFLIIGIFICTQRSYKGLQTREMNPLSVPLFYFLSNYLFILIFMELNWDRYYLPTIMAAKIMVAIGIYESGLHIYRYFYRNKPIPSE
jgi:4-amino-4-deoxy-L-arabinose transferase-like glycosyltransferase